MIFRPYTPRTIHERYVRSSVVVAVMGVVGLAVVAGIGELDRVAGGGFVPGSATLIGGEPGIGKSTLMLQIALNMPNYGDPKYWDKRYSDNQGNMFDWLEDYDSLRPLFQ